MNMMDTTALNDLSYSKSPPLETGATQIQNIRFELVEDLIAVRSDWQALEAQTFCTPFQTYAWTHAWRTHVTSTADVHPAIIIGRDDNDAVQVILPLALRKQGPVTILEWLAGDHASYSGGLFRTALLNSLNRAEFLSLWAKITELLPPFDIAQFLAQTPMLNAHVNPTTYLGTKDSASTYFRITIDADFEALHLDRRSRTTRRSERRRERHLSELGPLMFEAHYEGSTQEQATDVMFEQRSARFTEQGIHDFLADPGVADFYRALTKMTMQAHGIEGFVSTLSVGDTIAAGLLNITHNNINYALVSSMTTDEAMRKPSPGEILMRNTLKHCCEKGMDAYDCGGGYDIYKDSWSDLKFHTLDTVSPQTILGSAYAGSYNGFLAAKSHIKQSPTLWKAFKVCRKLGFWS